MRSTLTLRIGTLIAAAGVLTAGPDPAATSTVRELLGSIAQFTNLEWLTIERGDAVAKVLETDVREVAVAGAVRISGSRDQLIQRSRDLDILKTSSVVLDASRFSAAPSAADLQRVTFEDRNLDLRACTPGNCPVRLSAADIARFHREVTWTAADWRDKSAAVWRDVLAGYAAAYLSNGRAALPDYANKRESLSVAAEVALLLNAYGFVAAYSPEFYGYLRDFGPRGPSGAEHMLYWTKEDFGIRPIFRISHQVIYRNGGATPATLIATNQVYADHYLDAALTVTLALDAGRDFYMISVSRARTRSLSGLLRRMIRSTVQGRSRDAMRKILLTTKVAIEKPQR